MILADNSQDMTSAYEIRFTNVTGRSQIIFRREITVGQNNGIYLGTLFKFTK